MKYYSITAKPHKFYLRTKLLSYNRGVSWGGLWGPGPPGVIKGAPKRKKKRKGKERERGEKRKKEEKKGIRKKKREERGSKKEKRKKES